MLFFLEIVLANEHISTSYKLCIKGIHNQLWYDKVENLEPFYVCAKLVFFGGQVTKIWYHIHFISAVKDM